VCTIALSASRVGFDARGGRLEPFFLNRNHNHNNSLATTHPLPTTHHATTLTRKRRNLRRHHGTTPRQPTLTTTLAARIYAPDHPPARRDRPLLRVDGRLRDPRRLRQRQERSDQGMDGLRPSARRRRLPGAEAAAFDGDAPRRPIPLAVDAAVVRPARALYCGTVGPARPHHREAHALVALGTLHPEQTCEYGLVALEEMSEVGAEQLSGARN
jgi:hypothetical protein